MTIHVHDVSTMLLGTRGYQQVRDGDPVTAGGAELALGEDGRREGLGIHAQVASRAT